MFDVVGCDFRWDFVREGQEGLILFEVVFDCVGRGFGDFEFDFEFF